MASNTHTQTVLVRFSHTEVQNLSDIYSQPDTCGFILFLWTRWPACWRLSYFHVFSV